MSLEYVNEREVEAAPAPPVRAKVHDRRFTCDVCKAIATVTVGGDQYVAWLPPGWLEIKYGRPGRYSSEDWANVPEHLDFCSFWCEISWFESGWRDFFRLYATAIRATAKRYASDRRGGFDGPVFAAAILNDLDAAIVRLD